MNWLECMKFIEKFNGTYAQQLRGLKADLPTEAEWEFACRAGTQTFWSFGDKESELDAYGWHTGNAAGTIHPVGAKKPNAWGLFDMHGNVAEWTRDWAGQYKARAAKDPKGPSMGKYRVVRGGARNSSGRSMGCAVRGGQYLPTQGNRNVGFRVVLR